MTRMDTLPEGEPVTVAPMKTFPIIRDLVTDVSFNYEVAKTIPAFKPGPEPEGGYRMMQIDVERGQEFRKCIECFMCQDVCHVIRDHEDNKPKYAGPRFFIRFAELEMHPLDVNDRRELAHDKRPRHVQHHQVLHRGLPRAHQDHRQRHHPDEGARGRRPLRPGGLARAQDHGALEEDRRRGSRRLSPGASGPPGLRRRSPAARSQRVPRPRLRLVWPSLASPWPATSRPNGWSPSTPHWARSTCPTPSPRPARARWPRPTARSAWSRWSPACPGTERRWTERRCAWSSPWPTAGPTCASTPRSTVAGTATIVLGYADALAMARGELDPADALAAGRVRVRGDLAALVAGQDVLAAAAARLGDRALDGADRPAPTAGHRAAAD